MKKKISTSGLTWKDGGFTRLHYWLVQSIMSLFILSGLALLVYAFTWRNTFTYETFHILVFIAVAIFLMGIAAALLSIFELLFFIGLDRLGILSKEDDEEKEES